MGTIIKITAASILSLGLAIPAGATAEESAHRAPVTIGATSAGVITLR